MPLKISAPDEKECVHTVRSVRNGLEEKFLFDHFSQFHIVRVLEHNDARMTQNDPSHRNRTQSMDGRNRIATHRSITDCLEVGNDRKG